MKNKLLYSKPAMWLWFQIAYFPYYIMLVTVLLLWITEGVAMQSGWIACPRPH